MLRFEWEHGWVKIIDVDGKVWLIDGIRWHRTYIALDEDKRIWTESCRPFYKTNEYEPWLVQTKVVQDAHLKIGTKLLKTLIQYRLRMYTCRHRGTSRNAEKVVGHIAKGGGWVSTACKDGVFLSLSS